MYLLSRDWPLVLVGTLVIAPGLEAIASGFSLILPDDQANLAKQFVVYDALYAWCRLQVSRQS